MNPIWSYALAATGITGLLIAALAYVRLLRRAHTAAPSPPWATVASRFARTLLVLATWPPVYLADRLRGVDPPASFRVGLAWARGERRG